MRDLERHSIAARRVGLGEWQKYRFPASVAAFRGIIEQVCSAEVPSDLTSVADHALRAFRLLVEIETGRKKPSAISGEVHERERELWRRLLQMDEESMTLDDIAQLVRVQALRDGDARILLGRGDGDDEEIFGKIGRCVLALAARCER